MCSIIIIITFCSLRSVTTSEKYMNHEKKRETIPHRNWVRKLMQSVFSRQMYKLNEKYAVRYIKYICV